MYYPEARILTAWRAVHEERDPRAAEEMRNFLDRRAAMEARSSFTHISSCCSPTPWLRLGRPDEAQAAIKEGLARAEATGEHFCTAELHRLRACAAPALDAVTLGSPGPPSTPRSLPPVTKSPSRIFELPSRLRSFPALGRSGRAAGRLRPAGACLRLFHRRLPYSDLKDAKALLEELA